jgi:hypothetical protein
MNRGSYNALFLGTITVDQLEQITKLNPVNAMILHLTPLEVDTRGRVTSPTRLFWAGSDAHPHRNGWVK